MRPATKREVTGTQAPNAITDFAFNGFNELCAKQAGTTTSAPPAWPTSSPPYTYDKNGNQLSAPGRSASYNVLDQTTNLTISGSPTSLLYLGSGQDRWITEGSGSFQHNVLGLGRRTVGTSIDAFTRDDEGTLVSRRNGTARQYYLFDALGSVTGLTDSTGAVSQRYDYEPYGTPAPNATGQWAQGSIDVPTGQFGFAAGYRSVGGLYHYGQRYYDPADMRWTQPDPLDQTGDLREGNRYAYVGADPPNLVDPSGLHYAGGSSPSGTNTPLTPCDSDSYYAEYTSCRRGGQPDDVAKGCAEGLLGSQVARGLGSLVYRIAQKFNPVTATGACLVGTGRRNPD